MKNEGGLIVDDQRFKAVGQNTRSFWERERSLQFANSLEETSCILHLAWVCVKRFQPQAKSEAWHENNNDSHLTEFTERRHQTKSQTAGGSLSG